MNSWYDWEKIINPPLPREMRKDPKLKHLDVSGPNGPAHDRLRRTYYAARDKKNIPYDHSTIESDYRYVCHNSPELWLRQDDTPKELQVICPAVAQLLANQIPFA